MVNWQCPEFYINIMVLLDVDSSVLLVKPLYHLIYPTHDCVYRFKEKSKCIKSSKTQPCKEFPIYLMASKLLSKFTKPLLGNVANSNFMVNKNQTGRRLNELNIDFFFSTVVV